MSNSKKLTDKSLALIGVPTDIGAGRRGASMGPEALRVAGLDSSLRNMGYTLVDRGNLSGPLNPQTGPEDGYRHRAEVLAWCKGLSDEIEQSLTPVNFQS